jgi:hypothetical protein
VTINNLDERRKSTIHTMTEKTGVEEMENSQMSNREVFKCVLIFNNKYNYR